MDEYYKQLIENGALTKEKFTLMVHNPEVQYTLSFHKEDKTIGVLDFKGDALKFTGEAEESAKVFIDWIAQGFHKRLEQERAAERESCAELCATMDWRGRSDEAIWKGEAAEECAAAIRARGDKHD